MKVLHDLPWAQFGEVSPNDVIAATATFRVVTVDAVEAYDEP